jgi:hypothetical protein
MLDRQDATNGQDIWRFATGRPHRGVLDSDIDQ